ncbi:T9SS type A sorting domain-containing protein [Ulvibacter litoralis]|uniref:Por secretion system C-terminal sorting domain-containing protein n=1 Tax=Ulvibacter litoralis TaxID=227084 RepID=A0A1G7JQX1_9FLAO|nr:T9SS type A sorting domain-containing protein [Ulvibacter litoralis]GHC65673.1 hypothetical protein GCM10008083_33570 [Ulvibacter litoralis]SDF26849.1 Por secretion system C-terminal sorting domain-containing protein [Ulvibacter litoralis]
MKTYYLIIISLFFSSISLAQIVIDDFTTGEFSRTADANQGTYTSQQLTDFTRIINSLALAPTGPEPFDHSVSSNEYSFDVTATAGGIFEVFIYAEQFVSGFPVEGTGFIQPSNLEPFSPTLDLSEATTLNLTFSEASPNVVQVQFFFYTPNMTNSEIDQSSPITISGPGTYSLDLENFFNSVDPSNVGAIGYSIAVAGPGNYTLDEFWFDEVLSISEFTKDSIQVYPNPTSSVIYIHSKFPIFENFQIYSTTGKLIQEGTLDNISNKIDISKLIKGIYFLTINNETYKIIKE